MNALALVLGPEKTLDLISFSLLSDSFRRKHCITDWFGIGWEFVVESSG